MILSRDLIKKRILIVGANGMLGQRIVHHLSPIPNVRVLAASIENAFCENHVDYAQVDLSKRESVKNLLYDFFPDVIINTAAFTNVDKCETERELAWKVNVKGVEYLSDTARIIDAHLIHLSTDYVFDGVKGPYAEDAKPRPISYYGRTKLASENAIRLNGTINTILRTNVLYGPVKYGRPDFVKWVINSLRDNMEIKIVTDQINNPTYIDDLVQGIIKVMETKKQGIFNIAGPEFLSRYEFSKRIAEFFGLNQGLIIPIRTEDLKQPAPRPLNSGLIISKAKNILNYQPHSIYESFIAIRNELEH